MVIYKIEFNIIYITMTDIKLPELIDINHTIRKKVSNYTNYYKKLTNIIINKYWSKAHQYYGEGSSPNVERRGLLNHDHWPVVHTNVCHSETVFAKSQTCQDTPGFLKLDNLSHFSKLTFML